MDSGRHFCGGGAADDGAFALDSEAFAACIHDAQGGPHRSAERVQSSADGDGSSRS